MTHTTRFAALTLSVVGAMTFSGAAEANGLRLGFGGPMASFVASPTHGGGGGGHGRGAAHCAKKSPSNTTASRPHSEPRVARSEPKAVQRPKTQVASVQRETSKPKIETATVEKVASVSTDTDTSTGLTGSRALVQADNAASTAANTTAVATTETPAVTETGPANTVAAPVETAATATVEQSEVAAADTSKDVGCKKFIPSVGVTIDVGCEK